MRKTSEKALHTVWTKHLGKPEEKERFEKVLRNSTIVLSRLLEILEEEENLLDNQETSPSQFDNPSWAHKQAFRLGEKSRIKKLKDLLGFIQK